MVQETTNDDDFTALTELPVSGRILAIDPGTKRVGVAVCDEGQMISRAVGIIERQSWKKLLLAVKSHLVEFDAAALVVGLPYNSDGSESEMSAEARTMAAKFRLSLDIPVLFQDERGTSYEARGRMWASGGSQNDRVDAEAAAIILADFLDRLESARSKAM
ncbi:MAG: Holliday junction resolvase RuvX [Acidobacteriota bacterium]